VQKPLILTVVISQEAEQLFCWQLTKLRAPHFGLFFPAPYSAVFYLFQWVLFFVILQHWYWTDLSPVPKPHGQTRENVGIALPKLGHSPLKKQHSHPLQF